MDTHVVADSTDTGPLRCRWNQLHRSGVIAAAVQGAAMCCLQLHGPAAVSRQSLPPDLHQLHVWGLNQLSNIVIL